MTGENGNTTGFEGVVIPASDMAALITSDEQQEPTDRKPGDGEGQQQGDDEKHPKDPKDESDAGHGGESAKIKVRDGEYTEDEIAEALEDRKNKAQWQKQNTEDSQKWSSMRKAIEPVVAFIQKLKSDGDLAGEIREAAVEKFGEEFGTVIDAAIAFDGKEVPHPLEAEHAATKKELDELKARVEGERAINSELKDLRKAHGLNEDEALEVLHFAEKKFEETGQALTLEDAFRLKDYEVQKQKAEEKKKPKVPDTPRREQGAREFKQPAGSYEGISIEGYKLFD